MSLLEGRVAVVTGASRGIGAAIAGRLAAEGAAVACLARTLAPVDGVEGSLAETVAAIEGAGGRAVAVACDLSRPDDRERAVAEVVAALGPVDVLVNNAAVTFFGPVTELPRRRAELMLEVQVHAAVHLTAMVLPGMRARGDGWVLNITSRSARHPVGPPYPAVQQIGFGWYGMVKAALERFTTALAAEGHADGIRANALAPWHNVATPGAGAHGMVEGLVLEDASLIADLALRLVSGDETGLVTYTAEPT